MTRTSATPLARVGAALLGASLAAGLLPVAAEAAPAPKPSPAPAAKVWTTGGFTAGRPLAVSATCAKATTTSAVVTGPRGMRATLAPARKGAPLTGRIGVPKALDAVWIRLRATCADGSTASVVVRRAATPKPAPKPKPKPAPKPAPVKVWAEGRMRPGATLGVFAQAGVDRKGAPVTRATVVGPRGMKATLTPLADAPWLGGTITVPKNLQGSWIRLTMTTATGAQATTIVRS